MKKRMSIFSFSFLDIMTSLVIISLILLFSSSALFSLLPFNERLLAEVINEENRIKRGTQVVDSLQNDYTAIRNTYDKNRNILEETVNRNKITIAQVISIKKESLTESENNELIEIPYSIETLKDSLRNVKNKIGVVRDQFVKRRYQWIKELTISETPSANVFNKIPFFYCVRNDRIIDFETNRVISLENIFEKHKTLTQNNYPLFIVERSAFGYWSYALISIEKMALVNSIRFGYEPYNNSMDVIYENYLIDLPR